MQSGITANTGQISHRLPDLQCIAYSGRQRLTHVGDHSNRIKPRTTSNADDTLGEASGERWICGHRAIARFDIHHQCFEAGGQFFGQDRRRD